eukprot:69053_1
MNTTVNETPKKEDDFKPRKIHDKAHILWVVTFIANAYDYYTDMAVVTSWFKLCKHKCAGFGCSIVDESLLKSYATQLAIFSSVGFIAGIVIKIVAAYGLYQIYNYGKTKEAKVEKEEKSTKLQVYIVWIPLVFENLVSLWLIFSAFKDANVQYIGDNRPIMIQSMVMSFVSICVTLALKLRKVAQLGESEVSPGHKSKNDVYYINELRCGCCWCFGITAVSILTMFALIMVFVQQQVEPIVMLNDDQTECRIYNEGFSHPADNGGLYRADGDHVYNGSVLVEPVYVYPDCAGTEYEYRLHCRDDVDGNTVKLLHCTLNWEFTGSNLIDNTHCYSNLTRQCRFDIELGECGNYIVKCDEFSFHEGDPEMWACFDYCDV